MVVIWADFTVTHTYMHYNPTPKNRFEESLLNKNVFAITCELVPGRGSRSKIQDNLLAFAEKAVLGGQIQALSITENAGCAEIAPCLKQPFYARNHNAQNIF